MGLAGFERARRRLEVMGEETPPIPKTNYVKQPDFKKPWCSICDKKFQNLSAYDTHMKVKHKL